MRTPKPPKAPKPPKQIKIGPKLKHLLKPKLPAHMKGGKHGAKPVKPGLPPGALPPAPAGLPGPNTTADLYVSPNAPPAAPDQAGVAVHLEAEFEMATQHSRLDPTFRWTHRMYVQDTTDFRDSFPAAPANSAYIPNKTGTQFLIVFVEVLNRNTFLFDLSACGRAI